MPNFLPGLLIFTMWVGSITIAAVPYLLVQQNDLPLRIVAIAIAAPLFAMSFLLISGLLSWPAQRKIIRGRFPRQLYHRVYFWRRIYGACWTTVYYFKPLYSLFLAVPIFKKMLFKIFGYKGQMNFVIYPDTWVRDLPLLRFGEGAYLSNRSTIGTNMCLKDGTILVDKISIGDRSIVGHLAAITPGAKLEDDVELGGGSVVGLRCRFKKNSRIGPACALNHGLVLGQNSEIGGHSTTGLGVEIGENLKLPIGSLIPAGAVINSQADIDKYFSLENQALRVHMSETADILKSSLEGMSLNE